MNDNLTEIVCVLDRSGSMSMTKQDTIGGFNEFLSSQKEMDGEVNVTLVLFDDKFEKPYDGVDISEVEALTDSTFVPRGTTALLDAIGRTIDEVGARLASVEEDERPGKVIFVILTDGAENASKEYTHGRIKEMIDVQQDTFSWEFLFLGANIDATKVGSSVGIRGSNSVTYNADALGTSKALGQINYAVRSYRASGAVAADWKDADASGVVDSTTDSEDQPES